MVALDEKTTTRCMPLPVSAQQRPNSLHQELQQWLSALCHHGFPLLDYHLGRAFGFRGAGFGIELFVSLVKWKKRLFGKDGFLGRRRPRPIGAAAKRGANDDGQGSLKNSCLPSVFPVASV